MKTNRAVSTFDLSSQPVDPTHVYRRYRGPIMRLLLRGVRRTDAEDICHDTFRVFLEHCRAGRFDRTRDAAPYLRGIARNLSRRWASKRGREVLIDDQVEPFAGVAPAEAPLDGRDAGLMVASLIARLDDKERAVLVHYFDDNESQAAVAKKLGLSRDQVYRLVVRIRERAKFIGST